MICRTFSTFLFAAVLGGCSNSTAAPPAELSGAKETGAVPVAQYQLTPDELALDCKKLTGRMQVRILQIRDNAEKEKTSTIGRMLQSAATPIFGGTTIGADPDGRFRQDRAVLEAYNRQLAAKKCGTFNLDAELRPADINVTPVPTKAAPKQ